MGQGQGDAGYTHLIEKVSIVFVALVVGAQFRVIAVIISVIETLKIIKKKKRNELEILN